LNGFASASVADVQATLTAFTARACANDVLRYAPDSIRLLVCGGGAYNRCLMEMLQQLLPSISVQSTEQQGLLPLQVEAAAFAWLARQTCLNLPGNLPAVTGASGLRVLGAIYPA
jgi:anhydro-N-acetylmuramic acid kinase